MATTSNFNSSEKEFPLATTGEPTDQLAPEDDDLEDDDLEDDDLEDDDLEDDDLEEEAGTDDEAFDDEPIEDEEDLDEDEVKRLFPGEDNYTKDEEDEEPYEGIRHGNEEDEGLIDDNMTGMPVVPSPS